MGKRDFIWGSKNVAFFINSLTSSFSTFNLNQNVTSIVCCCSDTVVQIKTPIICTRFSCVIMIASHMVTLKGFVFHVKCGRNACCVNCSLDSPIISISSRYCTSLIPFSFRWLTASCIIFEKTLGALAEPNGRAQYR